MLGPREPQQLHPARDLLAAHTCGEGLVPELLRHRLRAQVVDPVGAHETAGHHEAGEFVAGHEHAVELGLRLDSGVVGTVREDRPSHGLRVASSLELGHCGLRMLLRVQLPVQIMQEAGKPPDVLVRTAQAGIVPDGSLHGEHVFLEPGTLDPGVQERERVFSVRHLAQTLDEGQRNATLHASQRGVRAAQTARP